LIQYRKAAERGYLVAQFNLGGMYQNGEGVRQDSAKALELWRSSAQQGLAAAQLVLGVLYSTGSGGLLQNSSEGLKWTRRAADQGLAGAQVLLGKMYQDGRGVPKNYTEAMKWYRKAADQEDSTAQNELGYMYAKGEGVERNIAEATKWFRKAADQGLEIAKHNLNEADPDYNRLLTAYMQYAFVKHCHEVREGYVVVYINDVEFGRAKNAIKTIETDALAKNVSFNPDAMWEHAVTDLVNQNRFVDRDQCQLNLNALLESSPSGGLVIDKDF
jgi:TPR repeat protein